MEAGQRQKGSEMDTALGEITGEFEVVRSKEHLLVFQPDPEKGPVTEMTEFRLLMNKVGKDHITVTPLDFSESSYRHFREFLKQFIRAFPDRDFQYNILIGNFQNIAAISLQPAEFSLSCLGGITSYSSINWLPADFSCSL
jgi:hypothetical protein